MPAPTWTFESDALPRGALRVLRLEMHDALSHLFEVRVEVQSSGDEDVVQANLEAMMTARASVSADVTRSDVVWGVLRAIEQLTVTGNASPVHRLILVPRLWYATQVHRSRVFQHVTVLDIADMVLKDSGLVLNEDYRLSQAREARPTAAATDYDNDPPTRNGYLVREYVVQYEETDYAFLRRLLEDEGLSFLFDHGPRQSTVVLTESNTGMRRPPAFKSAIYADAPVAGVPTISAMTHQRKYVPPRALLVDYDWRKPSVPLFAAAPRVEPARSGPGIYLSGAEHFRTTTNGRRLAQIRLEERRVERHVYRGRSTLPGLRAGDVFKLVVSTTSAASGTAGTPARSHPELEGEYLVIEVRRQIEQRFDASGAALPQILGDEFVAIRADVTYRPPRTTPKPRIEGLLYATIDSPDLDIPAPIDRHGRYKVVLPFDLAETEAGKASRWIRMAQPLSGAGYGVHFPLHAGAEVVLAHVNGDPDRPLIVGAVPNTQTPSPVTSANPTQSIVRTFAGIVMELDDDA